MQSRIQLPTVKDEAKHSLQLYERIDKYLLSENGIQLVILKTNFRAFNTVEFYTNTDVIMRLNSIHVKYFDSYTALGQT